MRTAPDPTSLKPRDIGELMYLGKKFSGLGAAEMAQTLRFWTMSISDFLDEYFETDVIKANFSISGIIGTALGPMSPGAAYVLLHHYMGEVDGSVGAWGYARGGMGAVTRALARIRSAPPAARSAPGPRSIMCWSRAAKPGAWSLPAARRFLASLSFRTPT